MHQKCALNSFIRMNLCNEHDELKFNPEIVEMTVRESEETLQKMENRSHDYLTRILAGSISRVALLKR